MSDDTFRVWVGCLGCYNSGHLVGEWFDASEAPEDEPELSEHVTFPAVHHAEAHEEIWCFDTENAPVSGEMSPMLAREWAETLESADIHDVPMAVVWDFVRGNELTPEDFAKSWEMHYVGTGEAWTIGADDWEAQALADYWEESGFFDADELPEWAQDHYLDILRSKAQGDINGGAYHFKRIEAGVFAIFSN